MLIQSCKHKRGLLLHHCSLSTPASPRKTSPTPIPSAPVRALTSRSLSSKRLLAVPRMRSATRSAVERYCSILWTPSVKRSMLGSIDWLSFVRWIWSAVGVVKVNADEGGFWSGAAVSFCDCVDDICRADSIAACSGSRSVVSRSKSVGGGARCDGAGDGGMDFDVAAKASHALFSSSSLHGH